MNRLLDFILYLLLAASAATLVYVLSVLPVSAQEPPDADVYTWEHCLGGDCPYVKIGPGEVPNAAATVTFHDVMTHGADIDFPLTGPLPVHIHFLWRGGADDTVTITPPSGYIAVPQEITPGEGSTGKAHIYLYLGG